MAAIAVGINGWRSPYIFPSSSILDWQFLDVLLGNFLMALASLPLWFGLVYYWLTKLAKVMQISSPIPIGIMYMQTLAKNWLSLLITQSSLLFIAALLASPNLRALAPAIYEPLLLINLMIAVSYQWLWGNVANQVVLDANIAKDLYFCATCQNLAPQLDPPSANSYLTKPEQIASELGNATYSAYSCDRCYPVDAEGKRSRQHIYYHSQINNSELVCTKCTYPTRKIVSPKESRRERKFPKKDSKEAISIWQCQNCFHEEPIYPYVARSFTKNRNYHAANNYDSSSSSYDSGNYGSSSSSDFGGGSSDGGGSGSDW